MADDDADAREDLHEDAAPEPPDGDIPVSLPEVPRRSLRIEIAVVLVVTFGLSAITATLRLTDAVLRGLRGQTVELNPRRSYFSLVDLGLNLAMIAQLVAWGALGIYLLWRSGIGPARIGLVRLRWRPDVLGVGEPRADGGRGGEEPLAVGAVERAVVGLRVGHGSIMPRGPFGALRRAGRANSRLPWIRGPCA